MPRIAWHGVQLKIRTSYDSTVPRYAWHGVQQLKNKTSYDSKVDKAYANALYNDWP